MRFTLVILAAALLLTNSIESSPQISALQDMDGDSWMFKSNTPQVNPLVGTSCGVMNGCPHGLTCYYDPTTATGIPASQPGTTHCYPTAQLGRPCNYVGVYTSIVLCGQGQECAGITPGSTTTVCRQVVTLQSTCNYPGEPTQNWCEKGEVCAKQPSATFPTCAVPRYNGDSCNPYIPVTVCVGGGTCPTTPMGEIVQGYCTGGSSRPFF